MVKGPDYREGDRVNKHTTIIVVSFPRDSDLALARTSSVFTVGMVLFPRGLVLAGRRLAEPRTASLVYFPAGTNTLLQARREQLVLTRPKPKDLLHLDIRPVFTEWYGSEDIRLDPIEWIMNGPVGSPQFRRGRTVPDRAEQLRLSAEASLISRVSVRFSLEGVLRRLIFLR